MNRLITLPHLTAGTDLAFLALRVGVGAFLVWGVWDNITSAEHMATFIKFLRQFGFPMPELLAPFDVWLQFAVGVLFILGLATRWAGLACALNFVIAIVMVDHLQGWRGSFGSQCLVLIGLVLATHGPGRFSVDRMLERR
ncbi:MULTISPECIES: DoxX family protein [unclassified Phenylobacterium]|jgi:putative oxidoreductase|uniref:DoxX family protein n=1 Tax=unclassified Phenylobacterium TaxID=2640670 RepID=UPI00083B8C10|nr:MULTISPECIES: DoxX family protein [unclassified Phenylobacterium]